MILDRIGNLAKYVSVPRVGRVLECLKDPQRWFTGEEQIAIDGKDLFVRPLLMTTKPPSEGKFEAHRVYADIQVVVEGVEMMQVALSGVPTPITEYDPVKDCIFFSCEGQPTELMVPAGFFAVFFPGEAHRPGCSPGEAGPATMVRKLVFKTRI